MRPKKQARHSVHTQRNVDERVVCSGSTWTERSANTTAQGSLYHRNYCELSEQLALSSRLTPTAALRLDEIALASIPESVD